MAKLIEASTREGADRAVEFQRRRTDVTEAARPLRPVSIDGWWKGLGRAHRKTTLALLHRLRQSSGSSSALVCELIEKLEAAHEQHP